MAPDPLRATVVAGHESNEALARDHLDHLRADVRAAAIGALQRMGRLTEADIVGATIDDSPVVRSRAAECAIGYAELALTDLLDDPDERVAEVAAFCCGERGSAHDAELERLERMARTHDDALVRESAVAALGAIGRPSSLPVVLDALTDRATVRRRAVIALAAFDGPAVEEALQRATGDRDWQVRQAAEDLLDVQPDPM